MKISILAAAVLSCCVGACATTGTAGSPSVATPPPLSSIPALDIPRYMGAWYEIAKLPNWFQRNCVEGTKAVYRLLADGQVEVDNRCRDKDGQTQQAIGAARRTNAARASELEVRFAPAWLSFVPMVWGNYWVIDIDSDYQLAAVSEPGRKYLWILSRTPNVDEKAYQALLVRLQVQGFDLGKLARTPQAGPATLPGASALPDRHGS
jgi:apolipoprotein D and lipocalin family protein